MEGVLKIDEISGAVYDKIEDGIAYDSVSDFIISATEDNIETAKNFIDEGSYYTEDYSYLECNHILDYRVISDNQLKVLLDEYNYLILKK